jgi:hypothetical protein
MDWREIHTKLNRLSQAQAGTPEGRAAARMAYHVRKKLPGFNGRDRKTEWLKRPSKHEDYNISGEYLDMLCRDLNFYGMASDARWKLFSDHPANCEMRLICE